MAMEKAVLVSPSSYASTIYFSSGSQFRSKEGRRTLRVNVETTSSSRSAQMGRIQQDLLWNQQSGRYWLKWGMGQGFLVWFYQYFEMEEANKQEESSVQLNIEKQEQLSKQIQPPSSQQGQKKEAPSSSLRAELMAMQFDPSLIDRVLQQTDDLQKAIELIVSELEQQDIQSLSSSDEVQLVLLVRMDLKMGLGKIAAQCAHATLKAYQQARSRTHSDDNYSLTFIQWLQGGQQKVAYQVADQQQLFETLKKFEAMGVGTSYIRDAGRTQIAAGSTTVGGVGPWGAKKLEAVTRALRRL